MTSENLKDTIMWFEDKIKDNDFPSDGLVILYDDIAYGDSLEERLSFHVIQWHLSGLMRQP